MLYSQQVALVAVTNYEYPNLVLSDKTLRLNPDSDSAYSRYLLYVLRTPEVRQHIESYATGTSGSMRNITQVNIRNILIPLPPIEEQRRIAAILDKADAIRRKRKQAIQYTEDLLRSAFLDMFGDPVTNPKGWKKKSLEEVSELLTGYPFKSQEYVRSNEGIRLCRGANVLPDVIDWSDACYWHCSRVSQYERFRLKDQDIVIALDRPWISSGFKIAVVTSSDLPSLLVQRVACIRSHQKEMQFYLYFLLRHPAFEQHCCPTETTVPHISPKDLRTYPIPVPDEETLQKFNSLMDKNLALRTKSRSQHESMGNFFNSLLQRAFRGEL